MITKHLIGYTKSELVQIGIDLNKFYEFMRGQTYAIIDDEEIYYNEDVARFIVLQNREC